VTTRPPFRIFGTVVGVASIALWPVRTGARQGESGRWTGGQGLRVGISTQLHGEWGTRSVPQLPATVS
jgi:hypothetical protein